MRKGAYACVLALLCCSCSGDDNQAASGDAAMSMGAAGSAMLPASAGSSGAAGAAGTAGGAGTSSAGQSGSGAGGTGGRAGSSGSAGYAGTSGAAGSAGQSGSGVGGTGGLAGSAGSAGSMPSDPNPPDPGDPEFGVRFVGRVDRREAGVARLAWSGSGIVFRFNGTHASVRMDDSAGFFTRLVDGAEQEELRTMSGERSYELANGLADGMHEIALYRRTEASFGATRFLGVELGNDGELLPPPPASDRQLELIGDSITCGYGDEGPNESCPFEAATENHWLSYGAISARDLDADLVTIAWSGKGVIYNYGDDKNEPMPVLYPRALPQDAQSTWDFTQWQPDAVVINLGTNDFSTDDDPSASAFSDAYRTFLEQLRAHYPDAWIVCLEPTMLSGSDLDSAAMYISDVVSARNAAGDMRVVERGLQFTVDGFGCDYHPSLATHQSMATALTAELQHILGW